MLEVSRHKLLLDVSPPDGDPAGLVARGRHRLPLVDNQAGQGSALGDAVKLVQGVTVVCQERQLGLCFALREKQ